MASLRVLLVASWYPLKKNTIVGSFFREQARALQGSGVEFRVVKPTIFYWGVSNFASNLYKLLFNPDALLDASVLEQDPPAYVLNLLYNGYFGSYINGKLADYITRKTCGTLLKDWVPDLIHGISYPNGAVFAEFYSKLVHKPYVVVEHNPLLLHYLNKGIADKILGAYRRANAVGVVSEDLKRAVLMRQPDCDPTTIWNLVDETVFTIKVDKPAIFTIATITYPAFVKDYKTFLKGIYELSKLTQNFRFIMFGNGSFDDLSKANSAEFEAYANELGISHLGTFIPFFTRDEIDSVLSRASLYVVTSISETYGIAPREAMMLGIPVVTTACGGVEDAINEETGIIIPIRNPEKLATAIHKIMRKEIAYNPEAIREFAIQSFGKEVFVTKMMSFYKKVSSLPATDAATGTLNQE